jgi:hypothetical protein
MSAAIADSEPLPDWAMIPLDGFEANPEYQKIITKARAERPYIRMKMWRVYQVSNRRKWANKKRTEQHGRHLVSFSMLHGERFGHCTCPAGTPPKDTRTGLPRFQPKACYHLAAAYFHHLKVAAKRVERANASKERDPHAILFGERDPFHHMGPTP